MDLTCFSFYTPIDIYIFCFRWTTAFRQSQVNNANVAAASYKADIIRGEYEEASNKVDNAKVSSNLYPLPCHYLGLFIYFFYRKEEFVYSFIVFF